LHIKPITKWQERGPNIGEKGSNFGRTETNFIEHQCVTGRQEKSMNSPGKICYQITKQMTGGKYCRTVKMGS
jgi:hypothetical protein